MALRFPAYEQQAAKVAVMKRDLGAAGFTQAGWPRGVRRPGAPGWDVDETAPGCSTLCPAELAQAFTACASTSYVLARLTLMHVGEGRPDPQQASAGPERDACRPTRTPPSLDVRSRQPCRPGRASRHHLLGLRRAVGLVEGGRCAGASLRGATMSHRGADLSACTWTGRRRFSSIVLVDRRGWVLLQERDERAHLDPDCSGLVGRPRRPRGGRRGGGLPRRSTPRDE